MLVYLPIGKSDGRYPPCIVSLTSPRNEVGPWVYGVTGSAFRRTRSWEEARDLYNARLAAGAVQVLS